MNGKLQERAMNCGSVVPNDEDWASEANGEQHGLSSQLGKLVIDKDLEKTVTERLDMLLEYFQRAKKDGSICVTNFLYIFIAEQLKNVKEKQYRLADYLPPFRW